MEPPPTAASSTMDSHARLHSRLSPEECRQRLAATTGRLWRWLPLSYVLQPQNVLMAARGSLLVLASKSGLGSLGKQVTVTLRAGSDGGTEIELANAYDPVIPIGSVAVPVALLSLPVAYLMDRAFAQAHVRYMPIESGYALIVFIVLLLGTLLRTPPTWPGADRLDPEVVAFVQRELAAEASSSEP
jgi:hypothetical protein